MIYEEKTIGEYKIIIRDYLNDSLLQKEPNNPHNSIVWICLKKKTIAAGGAAAVLWNKCYAPQNIAKIAHNLCLKYEQREQAQHSLPL